jgi:hypothetical protein
MNTVLSMYIKPVIFACITLNVKDSYYACRQNNLRYLNYDRTS